ncbi:GPN-loop GTPase [Trinorchestia longiramus]|nr:GPN-loop GTPase [Trinorchestia longiramus]
MRYAQLVLGPAGAGKSTYCAAVQQFGLDTQRTINVVNLDPAAEKFYYDACADVRELVEVDDVMEAEDINYGPNGGLIFCMEYLLEPDGLDWLKEALGDLDEDYTLFDCPGQIELYTHMDVMKRLLDLLQSWNFQVCAVFVLDSHYMVDTSKFLSGSLTALSAMMKLEVPHVNLLSKMDLLDKKAHSQLSIYLDPDVHELISSEHSSSRFNKKYHKLTTALASILNDQALVRYFPINIYKQDSIQNALLLIDSLIQYGDDLDVKTKDFDYADPLDEEPPEDD